MVKAKQSFSLKPQTSSSLKLTSGKKTVRKNGFSTGIVVENKFTTAAKTKALQKRKNTILKEYQLLNKKGRFSDKRIGEYSSKLEDSDRFGSRYAAVRMRNYKTFDDDLTETELTHHGKTISEIENFDNVRSDDDDDDYEGIDSEFVESAHFGGGVLSRKSFGKTESYKDMIDELIIQSKIKKAEKRKMKDETNDLTIELDNRLQPLMSLLNTDPKILPSVKVDEYDKKLKELQFGGSSNKLPEVAKEEEEKNVSSSVKLEFPNSYMNFENLLSESVDKNKETIKSLIKLSENNSRQRQTLCEYLFRYIDTVAHSTKHQNAVNTFSSTFKVSTEFLFDLAPTVSNLYVIVTQSIREKHDLYTIKSDVLPGLEVISLFKLVKILTPRCSYSSISACISFIDQLLTQCKFENLQHVIYGLFLVSLILEYGEFRKGYLPSAFNFLHQILYSSVPLLKRTFYYEISPLITTELLLSPTSSKKQLNESLYISDIFIDKSDDKVKLKIIQTALDLLKRLLNCIEGLPSQKQLTDVSQKFLKILPLDMFPKSLSKLCNDLIEFTEKTQKDEITLSYIVQEKKRPPALRLYEPKIQKVYEHKKHHSSSKEDSERKKLVHKYKKERKGALRELRRDNTFLANVKINARVRADRERLSKVKKIYSEGNQQQAELNVLKRQKSKKK